MQTKYNKKFSYKFKAVAYRYHCKTSKICKNSDI